MSKTFTRYELEHLFAENFQSPVFPILADMYYKNKEYNRAKKVCTLGLKHDSDNLHGQFILAKIYIINDQLKKAEKLLKEIVYKDSINIQALLILIDLEKKLKRSRNTIQTYIRLGVKNFSNHPKILKMYNPKTARSFKTSVKENKLLSNTNIKLSINKQMATKTMYTLMKTQKKYDMAISILNIMKTNIKYKKFVISEMKKMKKHFKKR